MAPRQPVFLRPASYRRKRVRDAALLLPLAGTALMLVPLMWAPPDEAGGTGNAGALLYVFGVWAGLIVGAVVLSRALRPDTDRPEGDGPP